jgi:hypothetical protein
MPPKIKNAKGSLQQNGRLHNEEKANHPNQIPEAIHLSQTY